MHVFEVPYGDVMWKLDLEFVEAGIENGAIVSLIGAVDSFTISTMPEDDATADVVTKYDLPAELHGSGEIKDGKVHIHATFAVAGDKCLSGHLHQAVVRTHFVRAYVMPA